MQTKWKRSFFLSVFLVLSFLLNKTCIIMVTVMLAMYTMCIYTSTFFLLTISAKTEQTSILHVFFFILLSFRANKWMKSFLKEMTFSKGIIFECEQTVKSDTYNDIHSEIIYTIQIHINMQIIYVYCFCYTWAPIHLCSCFVLRQVLLYIYTKYCMLWQNKYKEKRNNDEEDDEKKNIIFK